MQLITQGRFPLKTPKLGRCYLGLDCRLTEGSVCRSVLYMMSTISVLVHFFSRLRLPNMETKKSRLILITLLLYILVRNSWNPLKTQTPVMLVFVRRRNTLFSFTW